jgi:hypothetical protein
LDGRARQKRLIFLIPLRGERAYRSDVPPQEDRLLDLLGLVAVAEGASIRLRRRGVVTGAWGTTERRQLALSSAELHHGAARAKGLRAPAEVVGRTVWLGEPRGVPAGAQIFHRKGLRGRNSPSADCVRNRHGEQGDRHATKVC